MVLACTCSFRGIFNGEVEFYSTWCNPPTPSKWMQSQASAEALALLWWLYPVEKIFSHLQSRCYAPRLKEGSAQYNLPCTCCDLEETKSSWLPCESIYPVIPETQMEHPCITICCLGRDPSTWNDTHLNYNPLVSTAEMSHFSDYGKHLPLPRKVQRILSR